MFTGFIIILFVTGSLTDAKFFRSKFTRPDAAGASTPLCIDVDICVECEIREIEVPCVGEGVRDMCRIGELCVDEGKIGELCVDDDILGVCKIGELSVDDGEFWEDASLDEEAYL